VTTKVTRATMPGALRNASELGGGTVVHLIENPDGADVHTLGASLCGRQPSMFWSDWAPEKLQICKRCARKAEQLQK
jgi:hypothetical protein